MICWTGYRFYLRVSKSPENYDCTKATISCYKAGLFTLVKVNYLIMNMLYGTHLGNDYWLLMVTCLRKPKRYGGSKVYVAWCRFMKISTYTAVSIEAAVSSIRRFLENTGIHIRFESFSEGSSYWDVGQTVLIVRLGPATFLINWWILSITQSSSWLEITLLKLTLLA